MEASGAPWRSWFLHDSGCGCPAGRCHRAPQAERHAQRADLAGLGTRSRKVHDDGVSQPPQDQGREEEPQPPVTKPGQPPSGQGQPSAAPGQAHGPGPGQQPYGTQPYGTQPYGQQPYGGYQPYPAGGYSASYPPGKDPALAEWWRRLLARIIDGIVVIVLIGVLSAVVGAGQTTGRFLILSLVSTALLFGYDWLQHGLWGQTLGKRALGTMVVTADSHSRISGGAACGRAAVYTLVPSVPLVGPLFGLINVLWLTWAPKRQCLHDKAASTVVVKKGMLTAPHENS